MCVVAVLLAGLVRAGTTTVAVVHGEDSVAAGDRAFAQSLAHHAVRWYRDAGLDVTAGGDSRLAELLDHTRVAVLVQMSNPTPLHMATLRTYLQGGGQLIVCYSGSPDLAELMGVELGSYVKGDTSGRWSRMRFEPSRPRGVPETVLQTSPNLFTVKPVAGASQVLAWWEDRAGRRAAEPAWLLCRHGYWMTHVLLADGDTAAKSQLLLALAASCEPSLWLKAAGRKLASARRVSGLDVDGLQRQARRLDDAARGAVALAAAKGAAELERAAARDIADDRGFPAWQHAEKLRRQMELAYGWLQAPRGGEIRAVWDRSGMGLYPGDWGRTCQLLKDNGISDLFICAGGPGFSNYRSAILPPSRAFLEQGDQLVACLAAAKPRGLRVHAWLFCFSTELATEDRLAIFRKRGWLLSGEDGRERHWLDPAVPDVRAQLAQAAHELCARYAIDGIHLDFLRYPDFTGSLGAGVRKRFETDQKKPVSDWPREVKSGPRRAAFMRWRCDRVTDLVAAIRNDMRRDSPGRLLTAAVFGKYPSCADAVGQDWEAWLRQGYVDYLLPMDYTEDLDRFRGLVEDQTHTRAMRKHMLPAIGVTAAESRLNAGQVIDQVNILRANGCPGFGLFDLDTYLEQDILPVLKVGIAAP